MSALLFVGAIVGYLAGSIPFGVILARAIRGVDLRSIGSGNIGATNATRALGKKWGLVVLLLDILKGYLPTVAAGLLVDRASREMMMVTVAQATVIGHLFPVWLGFRGGKGVATAFGAILAVLPLAAAVCVVVFAVMFLAKRIVSLGSMTAAASLAVMVGAAWIAGGETRPSVAITIFSLLTPALIIGKHIENIRRLQQGTEPKFGSKPVVSAAARAGEPAPDQPAA